MDAAQPGATKTNAGLSLNAGRVRMVGTERWDEWRSSARFDSGHAEVGQCYTASNKVTNLCDCGLLAKHYSTRHQDLEITLYYGGEHRRGRVGR